MMGNRSSLMRSTTEAATAFRRAAGRVPVFMPGGAPSPSTHGMPGPSRPGGVLRDVFVRSGGQARSAMAAGVAAAPVITSGESLGRLLEMARHVPGEKPETLCAFMDETYAVGAVRDATPLLGALSSPDALSKDLNMQHANAELLADNVVLLQAKRFPEDATQGIGIFGVLTKKDSQEPAAYFVRGLFKNDEGKRIDSFDYICTDISDAQLKGIGSVMVKAMDAFVARFGAEKTVLHAAWIGRYRWAVDGFDFLTDAESKRMRAAYGNFKKQFALKDTELVFDRGDGTVEPYHADNLVHAWDYAHLRSVERKLVVPTMVGENDTPVQELDVGRAFLIGDATDEKLGHCFIEEYEAMRPLDKTSPGQLQAARYRAIREKRSTAAASGAG